MKALIGAFLASTALAVAAKPALKVEAEVTPPRPWVQSQAIYTLRVYQSADVRKLELVGPQAALADVRPLGAASMREVERDGRRYRLHERRFAIFPFASGSLALTAAHVSGRLPGTAATTRWDAPALALQVQAVPPGIASGHWLPAHRVTISETWSPPGAALTLNGLARRSIRIEAEGADAAQIPQIVLDIPGMRVNALAPRLDNRIEGKGFVGIREQDFQLVPLQAGKLLVPPVELSWWKVAAGTQVAGVTALASLPPRTLEVAGAVAARPASPPHSAHKAFDMLLPAGALMAVLGSALWLIGQVRRHPLWALRRACAGAKPEAARSALLDWAAGRWRDDPPRSLPALAARLAPDRLPVSALHDLDRRLYGIPLQPWQAAPVWQLALRATLRRAARSA